MDSASAAAALVAAGVAAMPELGEDGLWAAKVSIPVAEVERLLGGARNVRLIPVSTIAEDHLSQSDVTNNMWHLSQRFMPVDTKPLKEH